MGSKNAVIGLAQKMARQIVAEQTRARLMIGFDAAIIAAHNVFGMGPGRSAAFANAYNEATEWLAGLYVDDADLNGDKKIEYAKAKRDELIKSIVGEANFVPFEACYGEAYFDEARRIRIEQGKTEGR